MKKPVIILGAGCAGLAAGLRLSKRGATLVILEKDDHVGGLAGGVHINENQYEYGPHIFHSTDPEILADVKNLMGDDLEPYHRTIKIKFLNRYFQFPLAMTDVFLKLPPLTVIKAGFSFLRHFITGLFSKPAIETSETLLQRYYGDVLYRIFFKDYITSVWGITPAEFSPAFARQRIPRLNLIDAVQNLLDRLATKFRSSAQTDGFVEKVAGDMYSTKHGFSMITNRMADHVRENGGRVELNARVKKIIRDGSTIIAVDYEQAGRTQRIDCSAVINTLPINEAVLMLDPKPESELDAAAKALRFRSLVFVGLLINRPRVLPASFMYFRDYSFNRISDLAQFGFEIKPSGATILVAEISCSVNDLFWKDEEEAKRRVLDDLLTEGLITREEILSVNVFRAEHAYPIYTLGYEKNLAALIKSIESMNNFATAGRQGRFQYINTHIAMKMGYQAADRILKTLS